MPKDTHTWLTVKETSARCGVSRYTLTRWRRQHYGPAPYRISDKKVLYDEGEVDAWINGRKT